jgi:hypothetical protein
LLHLSRGGLGEWLHMPPSDYWWGLIQYAFHYSLVLPILLLVLLLYSAFKTKRWRPNYNSLFLIGNAIGIYVIAYFYSKFVNPVLHQSVVIFSLPFFFVWIAGRITLLRIPSIAVASLILIFNSFTLIVERNHYQINYSSQYSSSLSWLAQLEDSEPSLENLVDLRPDFVELLSDFGLVAPSKVRYPSPLIDSKNLQSALENCTAQKFFLAINNGSSPELFATVLDHYPCIEKAEYYHAGAAYLLSKACESRIEISNQEVMDETLLKDSPYSSHLDWDYADLSPDSSTHFVLTYAGYPRKASIVVEATYEGVTYWRGVELTDFKIPQQPFQKAYQAFYNSEVLSGESDHLKAYVWFAEGVGIQLQSFKAYSVPANPNKSRLFSR